jgi:signal transduction protein with GAF and PtsI domain
MATRPLVDDSANPLPMDRLLLAEELLDLAERAQIHARATGSAIALPRGEKLVIRTSTGIAPEVGASLPIGEGTIGECARSGKPHNVSEENENKMDAALCPLGVQSLIAVPIHHAGIFYGVLVVLAQSPEAFTRMHVAIMMTMGNEIARVLKRLEAAPLKIAPGMPLRLRT